MYSDVYLNVHHTRPAQGLLNTSWEYSSSGQLKVTLSILKLSHRLAKIKLPFRNERSFQKWPKWGWEISWKIMQVRCDRTWYNILEVLKACRLYVLIESTFRSKIKAEDQLAHPHELTWNSEKQWGLWMIFFLIPKNNEDSWFRIPKGFSITTPSNINWQHICMNILFGHPPEVPNHIVWTSHLWVLNLTCKGEIFTILSFTKTHGNLVIFPIATLFGKDFLIIPLRLWNPVWVNMVKLSWFCRQKPVAHCTYTKQGLLWWVCWTFVWRKFTQDGPRHRL